MCSIYGWTGNVPVSVRKRILNRANERGRDGWGVIAGGQRTASMKPIIFHADYFQLIATDVLIGNHRATPTTEHESLEELLQPYNGIVHNGVISNDKEICEMELADPMPVDSMVLPLILNKTDSLKLFADQLQHIKGSFAIAYETAQGDIMLACNYKPIYYRLFTGGLAFASTPDMLGSNGGKLATKMDPYTALKYERGANSVTVMDLPRKQYEGVVVSASSGLDSTTVAYMLKAQGHKVHLVHFTYGCLAETEEVRRIKEIAADGGFPLSFVDMPRVMGGTIVQGKYHEKGVEGTEYAHDWVSARNLLMLSILTAFAEKNKLGYIAFGGNLEESGSYPDNEQEFGRMFNNILPYSTQNGIKIELLQPVSTFMKHEIVKAGIDVGAPFDLTWSCYGNGEYHCGKCGPCFMRKTAFKRNGIVDPVKYLN